MAGTYTYRLGFWFARAVVVASCRLMDECGADRRHSDEVLMIRFSHWIRLEIDMMPVVRGQRSILYACRIRIGGPMARGAVINSMI